MLSRRIIQDWTESVHEHWAEPVHEDSPEPVHQDSKPPGKRRRLNDPTLQPGMPNTPSSTRVNWSIPHVGRKRRIDGPHGDEEGEQGAVPIANPNTTPKPSSVPPLSRSYSRSRSRSESPTKRARTTLKSRSNLTRLEKPVLFAGLGVQAGGVPLSEDIRGLYKEIRATSLFKQHTVPHEVRDQMLALDDIPDSTFREPNVDIPSSTILYTHDTLLRIVRAAMKSEQYQRLEAGWNNHVHTPLLELVFGSDPYDENSPNPNDPDADQPVVTRFEAVMGATIVGSAIPLVKPSQNRLDLACSVSVDCSVEGASTGSLDLTQIDLSNIHSRSESKKVDYVLVMYIRENMNEKLRQAIWDSAFEGGLGYGYINQTLQLNLQYNPIAVSIKTKISSSQVDPLIQLALWTAAWHKRMYELRDRLFPLAPQSYAPTDSTRAHPKLVSVPLITVVSHDWSIYFACDSGLSIQVYGPLALGSTATALEIYTLVACLECVKKWVETTFCDGIKAWFTQA